jgi:hypothetical protein
MIEWNCCIVNEYFEKRGLSSESFTDRTSCIYFMNHTLYGTGI